MRILYTIFGVLLGLFTFVYWCALLKNIPHMWGVAHSKEWADVHEKKALEKAKMVIIFILGGIFGILLIKWSAQLLGVIN